ncbi:MAG: 3-dehydroquinate synthase [Actinomycetales bacterium]
MRSERRPGSAERGYQVVVGRGLTEEIPGLLGPTAQVAIIHPGTLRDRATGIAAAIADAGHRAILIEVPDAEQAKTVQVLATCWDTLGSNGFTRTDAVIGVGGGAVTDLAGFVAATWMRGISSVLEPTTLLGMVDAAIGGKTGINAVAGKNLIGAFHSPAGVVCDLDLLASLPPTDLAAGMAEVVKVGFTSDPTILEQVRNDPVGCLDPHGSLLAELVCRAVQVKATVVGLDFREEATGVLGTGGVAREVLNYGHTFGHAVEHVEGYRWRHGAAVSVGLAYVAELARIGGYLPDADADAHREICSLLGLPTEYAPDRWDSLRAAMAMDKKTRNGVLRFVILRRIGDPVILEGPEPALMEAAYAAISSDPGL